MSFERYMNDCMTRDWAADKQGLFSSVAPYTGLGGGAAAAGGLSFGSVAGADVGEYKLWSGHHRSTGSAGVPIAFSGTATSAIGELCEDSHGSLPVTGSLH